MSRKQYNAFICYSAIDRAYADAIHRALRSIGRAAFAPEALRIFRDDTSLAVTSSGLWQAIDAAIEESGWLIVLLSPNAARSPWVDREVRAFLARRGAGKILLVLIDGQAHWDGARREFEPSSTTAVPPSLYGAFDAEPLFVDLRWASASDLDLRNARFFEAMAGLAAPLHAVPKDELVGEELRVRRRQRRLTHFTFASLILALLVVSTLAVVAVSSTRGLSDEGPLFTDNELLRSALSVLTTVLVVGATVVALGAFASKFLQWGQAAATSSPNTPTMVRPNRKGPICGRPTFGRPGQPVCLGHQVVGRRVPNASS